MLSVLLDSILHVVPVGETDRYVCLGWCMLPLFDRRGNITRGGKSAASDTVRLALYEGSPRALYTIVHPIAGECSVCVCVWGGGEISFVDWSS